MLVAVPDPSRLMPQSGNPDWLRARFARFGLLCLICYALSGCQSSELSDLEEFVTTAYQDKKPEIESLPAIQPYKGFTYSAAEKDDPFGEANIASTQAADESVAGSISPDRNRRREPLEQYPLDALRLVGTMEQEARPWVIVQTSEGTAHRATVGNYMGQNEGKIKQIKLDEQAVLLVELVRNSSGRWVTREVEITIDE